MRVTRSSLLGYIIKLGLRLIVVMG